MGEPISSARVGPPSAFSESEFLEGVDPNNVPADLKKEGSDWFAVWNPKVKRVLDVSLVHTLAHERCVRSYNLDHELKLTHGYCSVVCCVRFSADGKYLATGCNRTAQIFDVKTGEKTCVLIDENTSKAGDLYIRSVCFSPDGKYLATGAEDKRIRVRTHIFTC
jgi:glucose repression regulatory protein TUP1